MSIGPSNNECGRGTATPKIETYGLIRSGGWHLNFSRKILQPQTYWGYGVRLYEWILSSPRQVPSFQDIASVASQYFPVSFQQPIPVILNPANRRDYRQIDNALELFKLTRDELQNIQGINEKYARMISYLEGLRQNPSEVIAANVQPLIEDVQVAYQTLMQEAERNSLSVVPPSSNFEVTQ